MINIKKPISKITSINNGVFLAGPCPRSNNPWEDWRSEFINILDDKGFDGDVINPTNENYDENNPNMYIDQCTWEWDGMSMSSLIVFWIDRTDEHPALTTNIEFGMQCCRDYKRIIVGIPEGSKHCNYIKELCKKYDIPCYSTMDEVVEDVIGIFNKVTNYYLTSDTHFGESRALEFSKRPYQNVRMMDNEFISNWNKVATKNDIIFHLGDFGNPEVIPLLQFKKLIIVSGNYEHDSDFAIQISNYKDVIMIKDNRIGISFDEEFYILTHEPIMTETVNPEVNMNNPDEFYLYGHIHEKGKVKRNGFNVGIDANNYGLVTLDTIRFYRNAILNHYDENVFTDICK